MEAGIRGEAEAQNHAASRCQSLGPHPRLSDTKVQAHWPIPGRRGSFIQTQNVPGNPGAGQSVPQTVRVTGGQKRENSGKRLTIFPPSCYIITILPFKTQNLQTRVCVSYFLSHLTVIFSPVSFQTLFRFTSL